MSGIPSQPLPVPPPHWPPVQPMAGYAVPAGRRTSATAVTSLVVGIFGCVPLVAGLLAVAFGIAGIRTTRDPRFGGRGLAIAGLVLGLVSLAGWLLFGGLLGLGYLRSRPARTVARQLTADLSAGNVAAAQWRCTGSVARASLDAAAAQMQPWGPLSHVTTTRFNEGFNNGQETCTLRGVATFANTRANFSLRLVKQAGTFKVDDFTFVDQNGAPPAPRPRPARPTTTPGG